LILVAIFFFIVSVEVHIAKLIDVLVEAHDDIVLLVFVDLLLLFRLFGVRLRLSLLLFYWHLNYK
jgi:hypothetical protein